MPEVIELRRYRDYLNSLLTEKELLELTIIGGRYLRHGSFALYDEIVKNLPLRVEGVFTKGKFMYIAFHGNNIYLSITLGLQGGFTSIQLDGEQEYYFPIASDYENFNQAKVTNYKKNAIKHRNILLRTRTHNIYFYDVLNYGTLKGVLQDGLDKKLKDLGPDILDVSSDEFQTQLQLHKNNNKFIANVLLDQKVLSGIGNYLRSDILWLSRISPYRLTKDLTTNDICNIWKNCKLLTWGEYDFDEGVRRKYYSKKSLIPKHYNRLFFVYHQERDIYNNLVIHEKITKDRTIHWVKEVQI